MCEGVNGEWMINGGHGVSGGRMKSELMDQQ